MIPKSKQQQKPQKDIEKPVMKTKKMMKKKNYQSFSIYLMKVLRTVCVANEVPFGITKQSMLIMNNFVNDMLEKVASEAGRLAAHGKKNTLTSREIQFAIKLLIPGELATHANLEGAKAIAKYHNSHRKE